MKAEMCRCDRAGCGLSAPIRTGTRPDDWWIIFGPKGRLDFCSVGCLNLYFVGYCEPHREVPVWELS